MNNEKIKNLLDVIQKLELSYQEKIFIAKKLFYYEDGVNYLHNYGFREILVCDLMDMTRLKGLHGKDTIDNELKSVILNRRKDGTIHVTDKTVIGQFGRSDKDNVNEEQNIICSIFDKNEVCVFSIEIENDDHFKSFKKGKKEMKRNEMKDFKNVRDTTNITWSDVKNNELTYKIYIWNNEKSNVIFD